MYSGIEDRLEDIAELCCCYGVARLAVFGSATSDAFDEGGSDIDLLVDFADRTSPSYVDRYFDLKEELEALLERPVDLVVRSGVRNPYFLRRATESSEVLYAS